MSDSKDKQTNIDSYGVWVKHTPTKPISNDNSMFDDFSTKDADSTLTSSELSNITDSIPIQEENSFGSFMDENPFEDISTSFEDTSLSSESSSESASTDEGMEVVDFSEFGFDPDSPPPEDETSTAPKSIEETLSDESIMDEPVMVQEDSSNFELSVGTDENDVVAFEDTGIVPSEFVPDSFEEETNSLIMQDEAQPAANLNFAQGDNYSTSSNNFDSPLLKQIADDLAGLKSEIADLKNEFVALKSKGIVPKEEEEDTGFFSLQDEDETISLSGDELDNIMHTADLSLEAEGAQGQNQFADFSSDESFSSDASLSSDDSLVSNFEGDVSDDSLLEESKASDISLEENTSDAILQDNNKTNEFSLDDNASEDFSLETSLDESFGEGAEGEPTLNEFIENEVIPEEEPILTEPDNELPEDIFFEEGSESPLPDFPAIEEVPEANLSLNFKENLTEPNLDENADDFLIQEELPEEITIPKVDDILSDMNQDDAAPIVDLDPKIRDVEGLELLQDNDLNITDVLDSSNDEDNLIDQELPSEIESPLEESLPLSEDSFETSPVEDSSVDTPWQDDSSLDEIEKISSAKNLAEISTLPQDIQQEVKSVLLYMDQLLESLPEDKITEFARSEQFNTYKKLFQELGLS